MANRYYTFLMIPEKTASVKSWTLPGWMLKGGLLTALFIAALGSMMLMDYYYVMRRIDENREMKIENRRLRQQVQIYKNRMTTLESSMQRIQTFATRLKVMTNIEDRSSALQGLQTSSLPDASENIPKRAERVEIAEQIPLDAESRTIQAGMEKQFSFLGQNALEVETQLQDLYELLIDQKGFLAALPSRKPTVGYFTNGFGVRHSPFGDFDKMHEGTDIANRPGTPIRATANGTVKFAGGKPGYGKTIVIDHGYGLETWYAHARTLLAKKDDTVRRGQKIALMGSTGRSTGSHVHYEVRVHGIPVDPLTYILEE